MSNHNPMEQETGRVVIRFGLDSAGDEAYAFSVEDVTTFEAWAGTQLIADLLHRRLLEDAQEAFDDSDDDA